MANILDEPLCKFPLVIAFKWTQNLTPTKDLVIAVSQRHMVAAVDRVQIRKIKEPYEFGRIKDADH